MSFPSLRNASQPRETVPGTEDGGSPLWQPAREAEACASAASTRQKPRPKGSRSRESSCLPGRLAEPTSVRQAQRWARGICDK